MNVTCEAEPTRHRAGRERERGSLHQQDIAFGGTAFAAAGLGFGVWGLGFGVWGLGLWNWGLENWVDLLGSFCPHNV
eukprot:3107450-Rhodomonas_salina.7